MDRRPSPSHVSHEEFDEEWLSNSESTLHRSEAPSRPPPKSDDQGPEYLPELHESLASSSLSQHPHASAGSIAPGPFIQTRVDSSFYDCHRTPTGEECEFFHLEDIQASILRPDLFFPSDSNTVNILVPEYDPMSEDKLQFFGLDNQVVQFNLSSIHKMSDSKIDEELSFAESELARYPDLDESSSVCVFPYDKLKTSVVIQADVRTFDWKTFSQITQFDVILMDLPWNIQKTNPTRGVELDIDIIRSIPIEKIQSNGFLFMWIVASILPVASDLFEQWGYQIVNYINWVKTGRRGMYAPSRGFYLQHCKETCLVGMKGSGFDDFQPRFLTDLIVGWRNLKQSHKPDELYVMIEKAFPGGLYLEIFARPHPLRDGWVSMELEIPK